MYKVAAIFHLNIPDDNDEKVTRKDLILKAKEIYESLKHISFIIKMERLQFKSRIESSDPVLINDDCFINKKSDELKKINLCGFLVDGFIKSIEEKTGKIEIGI